MRYNFWGLPPFKYKIKQPRRGENGGGEIGREENVYFDNTLS